MNYTRFTRKKRLIRNNFGANRGGGAPTAPLWTRHCLSCWGNAPPQYICEKNPGETYVHAVWSRASELTITPAWVTAAHWYTPSWPTPFSAAAADEDEDELRRLKAAMRSWPSLVSSTPRRRAACGEMVLPFSVHRMLAFAGSTAHVSATELPVRTTSDCGSTMKRGPSVDDVITAILQTVAPVYISISNSHTTFINQILNRRKRYSYQKQQNLRNRN